MFLLLLLVGSTAAFGCSPGSPGMKLPVPSTAPSSSLLLCDIEFENRTNSATQMLTLMGNFSELLERKYEYHLLVFFGSEDIGCRLPGRSGFLDCECKHRDMTMGNYTCEVPNLFGIQPMTLYIINDLEHASANFSTGYNYDYGDPVVLSVTPNSGVSPVVVRLSGSNLPKNPHLIQVVATGDITNIASDVSDIYYEAVAGQQDVYLTLNYDTIGKQSFQVFVGVSNNLTRQGVLSNSFDFAFDSSPPPYVLYIGIPAIGIVVLGCSGFAVWSMRSKKRKHHHKRHESEPLLMQAEWEKQWLIDADDIILGSIVGKGSFAQVFKASWKGQEVAVKIIPASQGDGEHAFNAECMILSRLHHPNIVQLFGAATSGKDLNRIFMLVTEFMPLGSMSEYLAKNEVSLEDVVWMLMGAARGIQFMHSHDPPIIHRDLKTSNLLVDASRCVKIADFGLSRVTGDGTMTACGTPKYAAPEVLNHNRYDVAADSWSFGVTIWECCTKSAAYSGVTPMQVAVRVAASGSFLVYPESMNSDVVQLIQSCQDFHPKSRVNFDQILEQLEAISANV